MTSQNLVAAAMLAQLIFLIILMTTGQLSGRLYAVNERSDYRWLYLSGHAGLLLLLFIGTFGAFFVSDVQTDLWKPLFGNSAAGAISAGTAISTMLVADIVGVAVLVLSTGGMRRSPFASGLLFLPTFAIFLREPEPWIIGYAMLAGSFTTLLSVWKVVPDDFWEERRLGEKIATWFMNVACLALATWIGILTKPAPF